MKRLRRVIASIGGCVLLWPAIALAAPPNDHFADREKLEGALPIEVTRSNVGATEEEGESLPGLAPAGRSVWFEWEAESDGWITVGACDADFPAIVGVLVGSDLASLTPVASGNRDEGPDCRNSARQYTFMAEGGTAYAIAVDGNGFHFSEPPDTEGEFPLRIEQRPPPANDDFAEAAGLAGQFFAGGADRFYRAEARGYNWGASKESGEPDHNGDVGGASVWYSWTAPADGIAQVGVCCGFGGLLGVYRGASVGSLTELTSGYGFTSLPVSDGATYRVAVDGQLESEASGARQGSFNVDVSMRIPEEEEPPSPLQAAPAPLLAPADLSPPNTRLRKRLRKTRRGRVWVFRLRSSEPGSTFRCKLDRRRWRRCRPVLRIRRLRRGRHVLRVFAVDAAGNRDKSAAVARFWLKRRRQ